MFFLQLNSIIVIHEVQSTLHRNSTDLKIKFYFFSILVKLLHIVKSINNKVLMVFLLIITNLNSQQKKLDYNVKFASNEIKIDGVADENS